MVYGLVVYSLCYALYILEEWIFCYCCRVFFRYLLCLFGFTVFKPFISLLIFCQVVVCIIDSGILKSAIVEFLSGESILKYPPMERPFYHYKMSLFILVTFFTVCLSGISIVSSFSYGWCLYIFSHPFLSIYLYLWIYWIWSLSPMDSVSFDLVFLSSLTIFAFWLDCLIHLHLIYI